MKTIHVFESKIPPARTSSFLIRTEYYVPIQRFETKKPWGMVLVLVIVASIVAAAAYKHFGA